MCHRYVIYLWVVFLKVIKNPIKNAVAGRIKDAWNADVAKYISRSYYDCTSMKFPKVIVNQNFISKLSSGLGCFLTTYVNTVDIAGLWTILPSSWGWQSDVSGYGVYGLLNQIRQFLYIFYLKILCGFSTMGPVKASDIKYKTFRQWEEHGITC